jgi:hypothetical protein
MPFLLCQPIGCALFAEGCDRKNCHEPAGFKCIPVPLGVGAAASANGRLPEGSRIRA